MPAMPDFLPGMALATAIGLLIGFERGWQLRDEAPGQRVAGVRTFAMLGLLGGLAGLATTGSLRWIALLTLGAVAAALLIGHAFDMRQDRTVSATGAIAALATMLLGSLAAAGHHALASAAAAALVALLSARKQLHTLLRQSSEADVKALVRLALVVFLVLPLLPDAALGPYGSLNPRRLWVVVVVIGTISFAGYILSRWLGNKWGGLVAASVGALVSSTAVTLAFAQELRREGGIAAQAGIAIASAVMLTRAIVLVMLLAPLVAWDVILLIGPALLLAITAALGLAWAAIAAQSAPTAVEARPPSLVTALLFASLVAIVSLAAAWLEQRAGSGSGALVIALGGMVDVDSAIAAIGTLPPASISIRIAALAIAAPVAFNTLLKLGMMLTIAGWNSARWAALALTLPVLAIAASAAVLLL